MHEAGLAASVLEIAEREARGRQVTQVHLKLGEFTGVVPAALEFAFEALRQQTKCCRDALLVIDRVPLSGHCPECEWIGTPERTYCLVCPQCESPVEILTGREMNVEAIDVKESAHVC